MTRHDGPTPRRVPPFKPNGELLLAQALEACIRAERAEPGSSTKIIARQPPAARAELRRLLALARSIEASPAKAKPSPEFVEAARARLMHRITGEPIALTAPLRLTAIPISPRRSQPKWKWVLRGSVGLFAAVVAATATLTASASSLPGEPLYAIKQAQEELSLRLAADDQARVLALLRRADARLEETSLLLQQGRTRDALQAAQRYDQSVERATTAFVVTVELIDEPGRYQTLETKLGAQQEKLETIIQSAPEPARPDLREALATTERGRELMADPRPVEQALALPSRQSRAQSSSAVAAAPVPTSHVEDLPTRTPTQAPIRVPTAIPATATPIVVIARQQDGHNDDEDRGGGDDEQRDPRSAVAVTRSTGSSNSGRGTARGQQQAPVVVRHDDDQDDPPEVAVQASHSSDEGESRGSSDDRGNGNDKHEDAPAVARSVETLAQLQANDRSGSSSNSRANDDNNGSRGNGNGNGGGNGNGNGGSSASRQAPPPQPAPAPAPAPVRAGSGSGIGSGSAPASSSRSGNATARSTQTASTSSNNASKQGGNDAKQSGGDSKSSSDSRSGGDTDGGRGGRD